MNGKRQRVAIVRQRYTPYGGAERFVARALGALERAGVEVTLIARDWEGWGARRVQRVDPFHVGNLWRDWSFAHAARAAWKKAGYDLVQSHERIPGCDVYRAGDGVHRRWLELRGAAGGPLERLAIAANPYHRYVCAAEKAMFEHPRLRAVICNSRMVRDEILHGFRITADKLHVIYNGVDLEHFHPRERAARRAEERAVLGVTPDEILLAFVGSGFARKGLDATLGALAQSEARGPKLVVAGRDRDAARYETQARAAGLAERVRFVGAREDVRSLYAAADCLILPSRYDPFPNTALEALAMGLPVIVSRRCGAAEVVEAGANGWTCDADDPAGLARLIRDGAGRMRHMNEAARASAEPYGLEPMAAKLTALYASL